ncbi:hypothetical protein BU24DRAFT_425550 [Aaosphaeria arxii CBS 175.79]|uniref:Uncharacterized protein n=1 Tax=Aaosphaeria arxii CBS 175.79 TaxID=1450172 RepID=A0A6A5XI64_9PLEO|nr:uncharacterized protein BU24DRAFT_425550 [Aaosphaeria arxii CBS 175.79]KAF2012955.1 hypothetical protein BU24DRAFT_425550 [Aaosphaeria arxii CBS 175.79]
MKLDKTGQNWTKQNEAERSRTKQDKAGQSRTTLDKAGQSRTETGITAGQDRRRRDGDEAGSLDSTLFLPFLPFLPFLS